MNKFLKFSTVGVGGFIVDSAIFMLMSLLFGALVSRVLSFMSAVYFTYMFNRSFTFESQNTVSIKEFFIYFSNMIFGGIVNISVFWLLVNENSLVAQYPIIGIGFGSVAGLAVNFFSSTILFSNKDKGSETTS